MPLDAFHTTRWSLVRGAGRPDPAARALALEELLGLYWRPLYAYLRRRGRGPERAADLVQGFVAQLLERDALGRIEREGGTFRGWLLAGLVNFERDEHARETAEKRGGGRRPVPIDAADGERGYALEAHADADPAVVFERVWAREVLDGARGALLDEALLRGKGDLVRTLLPLLDGETSAEDRAVLAERLGLSPVALRVTLHRLRTRLRELVLEAVRETLDEGADAGEELRVLGRALAGGCPENSGGGL